MLVNCTKESQQIVINGSNDGDTAQRLELSIMQNQLEWLFPKGLEIDLGDADYMEEFVVWMQNRESEGLYALLQGLGLAEGRDRVGVQEIDETITVTYDEDMVGLFQDQMKLAGMKTRKNYAVDHEGEAMDRHLMVTNAYLSFQDKKNSKSKTIVPIEAELDFISKLQKGASNRFGHTQELKSQRMGFSIRMKECKIMGDQSKEQTNLAKYICQKDVMKVINDNMNEYLENKVIHEFEVR